MRSATLPATFVRVATMVCVYSQFFLSEATRYQLHVCTMDGDYESRIAAALEHLIPA